MSDENIGEQQHGTAVAESKPEVKRPRMYKVLLLNDDYTPMDFVIQVLRQFFHKNSEQSTKIMLKVHYDGQGIAGVYTAEIAETKMSQVNDFSRSNDHPLKCTMEVE